MQTLNEIISNYVRETRRLESLPSSTETTFYPDLKTLLNAVLKNERLPFDVITDTSEGTSRRRDMPDFVLGEPRKVSETWPVFATEMVNLHVRERASVVFPRETRGDDSLSDRDANLPEATWRILRDHFGLSGERRDDSARAFVGSSFRVAFAVLQPRVIVTDGLRSYRAAMEEIGNADRQEIGRWANNRAENSRQPFRRRERAMRNPPPRAALWHAGWDVSLRS